MDLIRTQDVTEKSLNHHFRTFVEGYKHPAGAGFCIGGAIDTSGLKVSTVAKTIGVHQSSISRLSKGGRLTPEMAAKFHQHYGLDIDVMFQLEARCLAAIAKSMVESEN